MTMHYVILRAGKPNHQVCFVTTDQHKADEVLSNLRRYNPTIRYYIDSFLEN
jgi:hypothetical protein